MMKVIIYILIIELFAVRLGTTTEASQPEKKEESGHQSYIVNGENANQHEWPWQILLKRSGGLVCGGSLINSQWVLTAAHCVQENSDPSVYEVDVGVHDRKQPTPVQKSYKVKALRYHEHYDDRRNDVALLQLDGTIEISDKVKPIALPPNGSRIVPGKTCYATGWGYLNGTTGALAFILQEAELRIGNYSHCRDTLGESVLEPIMVCGGAEGKGACKGDSGGPLSCDEEGKWILRGVVSWGNKACSASSYVYTVFARVSSFISWIATTQKGVFDCDFEQNLCHSWEQDTTDNFDWLRNSSTGPSTDHTFGIRKGHYMYIKTSSPRVCGHSARLISKLRPATNQTCLSFWHHMYGAEINTLRVLVKKGQITTALYIKTGNQGDRWHLGQVDINSTINYQVIFEGIVGGGDLGDIAIDDIKFSDGLCKSPSLNCDFEEHMCHWRQETTDHFDWRRHRFETETLNTGPMADHTTGLASGYYMYFEASPAVIDKTARLINGNHPPTEHTCLSFWYHMYGTDIGTLKVLVKEGAEETVVLSLSGNSGNRWLKANVTIQSQTSYELILEAVRGPDNRGDIAIDDVEFTDGPCRTLITFNCTFEENYCFIWDQDNSDTIEWTRWRGTTKSNNTGPSVDHTTNTALGYYMYIEASSPRKANDTARLISKRLSPTNNTVLSFWYHMFVGDSNTLRVLIKKGLQETILCTQQGNQDNKWIGKELSIESQEPFQIIIEGIRGVDFLGDIAIDDVVLYNATVFIPEYIAQPTTSTSTGTATSITTCSPPTSSTIKSTTTSTTDTSTNHGTTSRSFPLLIMLTMLLLVSH